MSEFSVSLPLISDEELLQHVNRLLSVRQSPRKQTPSEPTRAALLAKFELPASGLLGRALDDQKQLFDALPDPVLVVSPQGLIGNSALAAAFREEGTLKLTRPGPVKEDSPLQERELVALVQKAVAMGLPRIFCPIGHTVYAVQPVQHDDRSVVIYFLPAISWRPRLPYSVRLALSLRLSGMAIKQVADATGVSLRSAQHVSRYYNKELLELRQRLSTAPNHLTSPCLSK